jgi:hypothetical protein
MGVDAVPAQLAFQPIVDVPGITRAVIWAMADGGMVEWNACDTDGRQISRTPAVDQVVIDKSSTGVNLPGHRPPPCAQRN